MRENLKVYMSKINDFSGSPEWSCKLTTFKGSCPIVTLENGCYTTKAELMETGGELTDEIIHQRDLNKSQTRLDNKRAFINSVDHAKQTLNASCLTDICHFITFTFDNEHKICLGEEHKLAETFGKAYKRLTYHYPQIYGAFVAFELHPKREGNVWHVHFLTYSKEWFKIDLELLRNKIWNLGRSNVKDARKIEDKANYVTTYLTKTDGKKSEKVYLYPKSFRPWRWYGKAKGEPKIEKLESEHARPDGASDTDFSLGALKSVFDKIKAEAEKNGYELAHSFNRAIGSTIIEQRVNADVLEWLQDHPELNLNALADFRRKRTAFYEERLKTMAFLECRFKKKSVKQFTR